MRDPFNSEFPYMNANRQLPSDLTRSNANLPSSSRIDYMIGNGDSVPWTPNSDSMIRHQFSGASVLSDHSREEQNARLMDPEIKELYIRTRSQEEEILLLRKQVADAGMKELQLLSEKHILERKLSDLRMALDEKQDDAISGALKELSQKKGHIEENLQLANDLKVMEEDVYIFTSSLLSLLAENEIRPPVLNASAITGGFKRVYQQMRWKLGSLNASLGNTNDDFQNPTNQLPRNYTETRPGETYTTNQQIEPAFNQPSYIPEYDIRADGRDVDLAQNSNLNYPYINDRPRDDNSGDGADRRSADGDYYLPGIEQFQIIGEAILGYKLIACGFPVNGTTLCIFQWVRYLENGTRQPIEGATVPEYVVTADDVDTVLAVDCTPMDDNNRQGELVRQFANNQNKITCDPDMQQELDSFISAGRASFKLFSLVESADDWEPTVLTLRRSGYQIKAIRADSPHIDEKYSPDLSIKIPNGFTAQFVLVSSLGVSVPFITEGVSQTNNLDQDIRLRDLIVLTVRSFQSKALDGKRKGKA